LDLYAFANEAQVNNAGKMDTFTIALNNINLCSIGSSFSIITFPLIQEFELNRLSLYKQPYFLPVVISIVIIILILTILAFRAENKFKKLVRSKTAELDINEKEFRHLFDSMARGVTYHDPFGKITLANNAACKILGLSLDQIMGVTYNDLKLKTIHEDWSEFSSEDHPSIVALKTGQKVLSVIMGIFNQIENEYCWIKIDAVPQFKEGKSVPFQVFTTFDDITKLKKAEFLFQKNEKRYKKAQNLGKVGNWEYNIQTNSFWGSDEALNIFGLPPGDNSLEPEYIESCIPERERVHQGIIDLIERGIKYNLEYTILPKNGSDPRIVNSIGELEYDINGKPIKILGVILDITSRKNSEKEIRESENKYRTLVESSHDLIWSINNEGIITFINKASKNILGYEPNELIGKLFLDFISKDQIENSIQPITHSINNLTSFLEYDSKFIHKNGNIVILSTNSCFVRDDEDNIIGTTGMSIDITYQKKMEENLKRSESILKEAGKISKVGGFDLDLGTMKTFFTDEIFSIYEVPKDSPPQVFDENNYYEPEALKTIREAFQKAIEEQKSYDLELPFITAKGNKLWVRTMGKVISKNGKAVRIYGAMQDITENKNDKDRLVESEKNLRALAEHLSDVREDERKNISREIHDELGQILTSVKMNLSMLDRDITVKKKPFDREIIHKELESISSIVDKSVRSVRTLIKDLRPEYLDDLGIKTALESLIESFELKSSIQVQLKIDFDVENFDKKTSLNIYRIVQESLTNAGRHSMCSNMILNLFINNDTLYIEISDDGIGFNIEEVKSNKSFGLLGMNERVILLRGEIKIDSAKGKGTKIQVKIPLKN